MRRITRMDQQIHHISGTRMLNENKMATSAEKIRRRNFGFWNKIILNAPLNSPERMLMGMPYIIWDDNVFQPEGRATHYAKTMARYLTERALLHGNIREAGRLRSQSFDQKVAPIRGNECRQSFARKLDANHTTLSQTVGMGRQVWTI